MRQARLGVSNRLVVGQVEESKISSKPGTPWGLCPQTPEIFGGIAPVNQVFDFFKAQQYYGLC